MILNLYDKYNEELNDLLENEKSTCSFMFDGFRIIIDEKHKLEDYLENPNYFYNVYKDNKESYGNEPYSKKKLLERVINSEYYILDFGYIDPIKYIDEHEILKNKKILLKDHFKASDINEIKPLIEKYNKYIDNFYIFLEGNQCPVKLFDAYKTMKIIESMAKEIENLKLSPIETVMYTYDIVRNRVYKKEEENESYDISRNLTSVLTGDKIVCVGYSELFNALLKYMGFNSCVVTIDKINSNSGHARNSVYINDRKYKIDGVYYFDTTWDCKKKNETNEFLNRYIYFARTKIEMEALSSNYKPDFIMPRHLCENFRNDILKHIECESIDVRELHMNIYDNYKFLNTMSLRISNERFLTNYCTYILKNIYNDDNIREQSYEAIDEVKIMFDRFNSKISLEKMIVILNNVRKVEYLNNPEFYPYDLESIKKAAINSGWLPELLEEEKLLCAIFGERIKTQDEIFDEIVSENNIKQDIESVHFTKVLQKNN